MVVYIFIINREIGKRWSKTGKRVPRTCVNTTKVIKVIENITTASVRFWPDNYLAVSGIRRASVSGCVYVCAGARAECEAE